MLAAAEFGDSRNSMKEKTKTKNLQHGIPNWLPKRKVRF